jgi:NitT/TauT family transport system substrate-binding protein
MQNRRRFLKTGFSLAAAGLAGAAALSGARRTLAEEAPPETTSLRLGQWSGTCPAPLYIVDDLLREEGFSEVRYVPNPGTLFDNIARGEADFGQDFCAPAIIPIDEGEPIVMLAGVHPGCLELFAQESIHSVVDLKGKKVGVSGVGANEHVLLSVVAASVGLDPAKDIDWVFRALWEQRKLFAAGEIDAFLTVPPWAQELHARDIGHVILSSALDRPWSQYHCCMLIGAADFVRRNPIATRRVVRAMVRAMDICTAKPDWVAQRLVDRGFTSSVDYWWQGQNSVWRRDQDYVRQGLSEVDYRSWRDYDPEDSIRFWALRLRELGMIKSSPDKIIATGTDWRFIKEVRKELGI